MIKALLIFYSLIFFQSNRPFAFITTPKTCANTARATCAAHLAAGCVTDGNYLITYNAQTQTAYCDMTQDGGGWMRLNANYATSSHGFDANGVAYRSANVAQGACSAGPVMIGISALNFPHTQMKYILTRGATILQCATVSSVGVTNVYYQSGANWLPPGVSTCSWSAPWANPNQSVSTAGMALVWKAVGTHSVTTANFTTMCSYPGDTGSISLQYFIK